MRSTHRIILCIGPAILLMMTACVGGHKNRYISSFSNESNIDRLSGIVCQTENMPFLKSLIVIQDGNVVIEKYMHGAAPDQTIDLKSASKSILSAVLGIAIRDGYIKGIDQKVMDFFPEYSIEELDPRIASLAIEHLVTMTSGFAVRENAETYQCLYESSDWIGHILNLPMNSNPGDKFNYLSLNSHLLSAIITKATGMSTLAYTKQVLFSPLSIEPVIWEQDPQEYYIGGWGMSMKARDMANFGLLYLNNGKIGQMQVVPSHWVKQSTAERSGMVGTYYSRWDKNYGYGYLWWIRRLDNNIDIPFALGHGGQRIVILPKANSVIVTQAEPTVDSSNSHKNHRAIDSLIFGGLSDYLLKSNSIGNSISR
jgi:CubicO group peptidase (beta-lactamase class C family)